MFKTDNLEEMPFEQYRVLVASMDKMNRDSNPDNIDMSDYKNKKSGSISDGNKGVTFRVVEKG